MPSNKPNVFKRTGSDIQAVCRLKHQGFAWTRSKSELQPRRAQTQHGAFFNWCCCEYVTGENTFRKKENFQHRMAQPTCYVMLTTAQIPLGTGSSQVCFSSGSSLMTLSVTCAYHPHLSCFNLTTIFLCLPLSQNKR